MKIKSFYFFSAVISTAILLLANVQLGAQGNLMITPRRVIFEGTRKTQELNIANTGNDTARYLISLMQLRMKSDGAFEQITQPDSGQSFATDFIRFFPRSVVLGPGEAQTIKMQVIRQNQLMPGEYRSHIYFRSVPSEAPLGEKAQKDSTSISVHLIPIFGISIPVIIRAGETTANITLSQPAFQILPDNTPVLDIIFNRSGNVSVYGDIKVDLVSPNGKETEVGLVRGIAVYTPTLNREFRLALLQKPNIDYSSGKLRIVYTTNSDTKATKLAETELILH